MSTVRKVVQVVVSVALAVALFKLLVLRPDGTVSLLGSAVMLLIAAVFQLVAVLHRRSRFAKRS